MAKVKQKPEKVFRVGYVSASVFLHANGRDAERGFRGVSLQRSYKDDTGKWRYANNFTLGDLPNAIRVLQIAQAYIESEESEIVG